MLPGLIRIFRRIHDMQPFTVRGAVILLLASASLYWFAVPENDLIAYMLGGGAIAIILLIAAFGVLQRLRLGRTLEAQLHFGKEDVFSGREVPSGITLEGALLLPFFSLLVQRRFQHEGPLSASHLVSGGEARGEKRHLIDTIRFPHRGLWSVRELRCTLRDAFGFFSMSWAHEIEATVEVSAPEIPIRPLPITASSSKAGDELNLTNERSGDLYDIKAYDPSDGIKRILWKTYAKSGELVVRRPEPAVLPEGEIAVYFVAEPQDDDLAGAFLSYLRQLENGNIAVLFGLDGIGEEQLIPPALQGRDYFMDPAEIRHAINLCVWSAAAGTGKDFERYLDSLQESNRFVHRVLVFGPARQGRWIDELSRQASGHNVKLTFAFMPPGDQRAQGSSAPLQKRIERLIKKPPKSEKNLGPLVAGISTKGGEVLLCERFELIQ